MLVHKTYQRNISFSRLRDFDDDSEAEEENNMKATLPVCKVDDRKSPTFYPPLHDSSDDSHDENNNNTLPTRNLPRSQDMIINERVPVIKQSLRPSNPRRIPSNGGGNIVASESLSTKGFVPKDLSNKSKKISRRTHGAAQSQSIGGKDFIEDVKTDEMKGKEFWEKVPRSFLGDNDSTSINAKMMNNVGIDHSKNVKFTDTTTEQSSANDNDQDFDVEDASACTEQSGDEKSIDSTNSRSFTATEDNFDPSLIRDGEFFEDYRAKSLIGESITVPVPSSKPVKSGRYFDDTPATGGSGKTIASAPVIGKSSWLSVPTPSAALPAPERSPTNRYSFVMVAHERGARTEHVQCTVVRDRRASLNGKLYPTYELILDETKKPIILAQKMNLNRTSNYHLFDLTRAQLSSKFSKKSGNYLGKLRAKNVNRTEYVLLNQNSEREEIAGVRFERVSLVNQIKDGNQPRKMKVVVPPLNEAAVPVPNRTQDSDAGSLAEKLAEYEATALGKGSKELHVFESKDPVLENGNYRLNFHGRVSKPSVKNFQMVSRENIDDIICQFGKVDEDIFHLDFKAPINAYQAFAFALCQFNL